MVCHCLFAVLRLGPLIVQLTIIQKPLVFERGILRRIFVPTKENQIWRVKTNEELDKPIKHKTVINYINLLKPTGYVIHQQV